MEELLENNKGYQILTDTGWEEFAGLVCRGTKSTLILRVEKNNIVLTPDHGVYINGRQQVEARSLRPGMKVLTQQGYQKVVSIEQHDNLEVFDILNAGKNRRFFANGILCSNCEFLIFDETLINAMTLAEMAGIDPVEKHGQIRWYKKPQRGMTYMVALDPSLGTGGDYAAIQVLEVPSMMQVAEWQHNKTIIQQQVRLIKDITQYIFECINNESNIYYSVENNTLGEAALVAINEIGEENIRGIFLSESAKKGQIRRSRKGFNTTKPSKLRVCAKFKQLVEAKRLHIASKNLISQLKNFIASGGSYAAKLGEHDDLVMSMLLALRMAQELQNYDVDLDNVMRQGVEDFEPPMPFILI